MRRPGCRAFAIDYRVMLPDGSVRHVHARADVMFDERGRARRMVGTIQDITERKRAEEELKASEQRFRRLVETTQVVPWTSDPEQQRFTYIGPQIEKIAGYPAQAWCTAGFWRSKLDPGERDAHYRAMPRRPGARRGPRAGVPVPGGGRRIGCGCASWSAW